MFSSQVYVSLPVYKGFMKIVIWKEHDSVSKINGFFFKCKRILNILKDKVKAKKKIKTNNRFSYFQIVSCYVLLSPDTIRNPQCIGKHINLPFYPGHRYAAIPGSSANDAVEVVIHPARPEYLVYHDHCFHLVDVNVNLSSSYFVLSNLTLVVSPR